MSKDGMIIKNRSARKLLEATAEEGRGGDSVLAHVALGEVVIPVALTTNAEFKAMLDKAFSDAGIDVNQYTVGHKSNSINPDSGLPEFGWFKKTFGFSSKSLIPIAIGATAGYFAGPLLGMGSAATATTGAVSASTAGAVAGAKIGATVAGIQTVADNADKAQQAARDSTAAAIDQANKNRAEAAIQAQAARDLAAETARLSRVQAGEIATNQSNMTAAQIAAQREGAAASLAAGQLTASQQAAMMQSLTAQQSAAAELAKAQLFQQQTQYAEQKAMMEKQAKDQTAALDAERRKIAERESGQMTARRRAGKRSLLSAARINPELGLPSAANDENKLKTLLGG